VIRAPDGQGSCLILMYHYVADLTGGTYKGQRGLSPEEFESQVIALKKHFDPITWEQFRSQRARGRVADRPAVMFSFDDGLACQAGVAAPILERHGVRGVFLVPGAVLLGGRLLDAHRVHLLLNGLALGGESLLGAVKDQLAAGDLVNDWWSRLDPVKAAKAYAHETCQSRQLLKYLLNFVLPSQLRGRILDRLLADHGVNEQEWAARWYGPRDAWKKLQDKGHTVGGHGFAHEPLAELSPEAQERDLTASHDALKDLLGPGERPMSYPFGSYDANTTVLARRAGFEAAMTTVEGLNDMSTDMYQLRRVDGRKEDVEKVLAAAGGAQR